MTKSKFHQIRLEHFNVVAQSEEQSLEQWKCNMEDKQKKDFLNIPRLSLPSKGFEQHTLQVSSFSWTELPDTELPDKDNAVMAIPTVDSWGWLSVLSLTSSIGVFLVALAYEAGRLAMQWSDPLFWSGLLVLFLPIAARLLSAKPTRRERIALLVVLGIGLHLAKVLQYPLYFAYHDEFTHWRTAHDIAMSRHLFQENPLLPISSFYPGLELVTNAISSLTGLSLFGTGIVTVSVARLICVLSLYLFYEHLSKSARVAGIGTLLYMANPQFLFFQAQFSYESLALPLAVFVLFALTLRYVPTGHQRGLTLVIWLGLGAIVITHHITSYALVAFLLLWTVIAFLQNRHQKDQAHPGKEALLGLVLCIFWLTYTGDIVLGYLAPHFSGTIYQIGQILTGESAGRQLFQNSSGYVEPLWERVAALASVALIILALPFGLFQVWWRYRANTVALVLAGGALTYPVSQALRLTEAGAESGVRATEFLFLGIAFVLTIGITEFWLSHVSNWKRFMMVTCSLAIIFVGQLISGSLPDWARIPGPYLISADQRSIEPEGITAAEWAGSYLGSGHRIASDRINTLLMATYGDELASTSVSEKAPVKQIFTSLQFGSAEEAILRQDRIQYLVVDHRLSAGLPWVGFYFDEEDSGSAQYNRLVDPAALAKFDCMKNVSRLFDSGNIIIYDVEAITNLPAIASQSKISCMSSAAVSS